MTRLHVHIDRLTLEGKTPAESRSIVAAMERHLTELANGVRPGGASLDPIPQSAGTDVIGSQIAAHVFQKLGGARNV